MVEIVLALRNVRQFISGADQASKSVTGIGKATEQTGKKAGIGWKSVAKWGGAATAVYGAQRFLRGAVNQTENLGKSTLALNRTTGLGIKTSSEWAAVLQARGQNVKQFQMGLTKLSREMEKSRLGFVAQQEQSGKLRKEYAAVAAVGGKDAPKQLAKLQAQLDRVNAKGEASRALWTRLGVSFDAVKRGDVNTVMLQVADAFKAMKNPAERAAVAQQLFARQGRELAPIFFKGSAAIREQLGLADKYGLSMSGKNAKAIKEEIAHQRELKLAYMGVQVQLGMALMPIILAVTGLIVKLAQASQPLTRNATLLKIALVVLTVAFAAYKVAMIVATIANAGFNASLLITLGWIALIVAALVVLGFGIYMLIKHWGWVKAKLLDLWKWIKANWPLLVGILLGPFALAAVLIVRHWRAIKNGAKAAVDWIISQFNRLLDWFRNFPKKLTGILGKAGGVAGKVFSFATHHVPFTQFGGHVVQPGSVMVGERGPELLSLPGGATVSPLTSSPAPGALAAAGAGTAEVHTHVYLDRREIARAVGSYTADKLARR
jgi:hypothetical protein